MTESLHLRPARTDDYPHYVRLFAELGVDDAPATAAAWQERMLADTLFLEEQAAVRVYGYMQLLENEAYVRHVAVEPGARGRGFGRRMMAGMAARAVARGCRSWRLNVMRDNVAAIGLYESLGMRVVFPTSVVRLPWDAIGDLPAVTDGVTIKTVAATDRERIERCLSLPPGLLAPWLARADHRVLVANVGDGEVAGLAHFDPAFPGAWPFKAQTMAVARGLLEALLPFRPAASPWIQLVVEDDPELALSLIEVGAVLVHDIVHMQGALPPR